MGIESTNVHKIFDMIKRFLFKYVVGVLGSFFLLLLGACDSSSDVISCVPQSTVNAAYNISLPAYSSLNNPGGYYEFPADGSNGSRGIIVVNTGTSYKAYDRNAPHICPGANTTLEVQDNIQIVCPEDDAAWILTSGQPLNDATEGKNLIQYYVSVSGTSIVIGN